ncbi:hypothetical protein CCR80_04455 [Rhodothalassium salexigens]|nr:hypothetical protein [Rhodothalassium salexigens]
MAAELADEGVMTEPKSSDPADPGARLALPETPLQGAPPQATLDRLSARFEAEPPAAVAGEAEAVARAWPDHPLAWLVLAMCRQRQGDHAGAVPAFERVLALRGEVAPVLVNWGVSLRRLGRIDAAVAAYRRALAVVPDHAEAMRNLAAALLHGQRWTDAVPVAERALALAPASAEAAANLGQAYRRTGRLAEAEAVLRRALGAGGGGLPGLRRELIYTLKDAGRLTEALGEGARAAAAGAHAGLAADEWVLLHLTAAAWDGLDAWEARAAAALDQPDGGIAPFTGLLMGLAPARQARAARAMAARYRPMSPLPAPLPARTKAMAKAGQRPLVIGYLSADFHDHATAWLLAEVLETHDRARVAVHGYSYGPAAAGAMRARLAAGVDRFVDLAGLDDRAAAERLARDGVDILVDLKGYTRDARPGIAAHRPAPLAVNYLGYPGTMGADFIDYLIADAWVVPPGDEGAYDEAVVRLPHSYQPNDRRRRAAETAPTRAQLGLPEAAPVFCCFNNPFKIRPPVFALWMRILRAVPSAVLWLYAPQGEAAANLRRSAAAAGVAPGRLVFAASVDQGAHLARLAHADLVLDTWPYGAHTTASDALWMGVPVLTCPGEHFPARVGASLVAACGLDDLIAADAEAYVATAVRLGRDRAALKALKARLASALATAPLFDTPRYVRHLEAAYDAMWQRAVQGLPPGAIDVPIDPPVDPAADQDPAGR